VTTTDSSRLGRQPSRLEKKKNMCLGVPTCRSGRQDRVPPTIRRIRRDDYDVVADLTAGTYRREGYGSPQYEPSLRDVAGRAAAATASSAP
jgi:hypothetical protein